MYIKLNQLKDLLQGTVPVNKSDHMVSISVGQSLLLLLDAIEQKKDFEDKDEFVDYIKRLFLEGTKTREDKQFIEKLNKAFASVNILLDTSTKMIADDPSKRYFETHLSRNILETTARKLNTEKLGEYKENLLDRVTSLPNIKSGVIEKIKNILEGKITKEMISYEVEFADLIRRLSKGDYFGLSPETCTNLYYIACNTILSTLITQNDKKLPVNTYDDSVFSMDLGGRGRIKKASHEAVVTGARGMMKSVTPVSVYDEVAYGAEDVEVTHGVQSKKQKITVRGIKFAPMQRPADQASYMIGSRWNQYFFNRMLQPYSNGISSTTFAHLRNIVLQKRKGSPYFAGEEFQDYMSTFAALIVYSGGGHSYFEIFEVFKLKQLRELFSEPSVEEAINEDSLMQQWLCTSQKEAFDAALQSAKDYAKTLLRKSMVNAEIRGLSVTSKEGSMHKYLAEQSIHELVINNERTKLKELLQSGKVDVDKRIYKKWTPLMIAAQLGRVECLKILLDHGAKLDAKALNHTALDLAIKNNQLDTVKILMERGSLIKNKWSLFLHKKGLKGFSLALYLAARQFNTEILEYIMSHTEVNSSVLQHIVNEAVKVENIEAIQFLVNNCEEFCTVPRENIFSNKFKTDLLKDAIVTGNTDLLKTILELNFCTNPGDRINYAGLLKESVKEDFHIVTELLLKTYLDEAKIGKSLEYLDESLIIAVEKHNFQIAMKLIIYGASPFALDPDNEAIVLFRNYLRDSVDIESLVGEAGRTRLEERVSELSSYINKKESSILHQICFYLVKILNFILPKAWEIKSNDKLESVKALKEVLENKSRPNGYVLQQKKNRFFSDNTNNSEPEDLYMDGYEYTNYDGVQNVVLD